MARKLKTFTTSIGFYDMAVAAPSMKAALEAWGLRRNLFHQGLAEETADPDIIVAAMQKPGVVLRRAVGSNDRFVEQAELPKKLPTTAPGPAPKKPRQKKRAAQPDAGTQKAAILDFEKAKARRDRARQREEAQRIRKQASERREEERRREAVMQIEARLKKARARHDERMEKLEQQRQAASGKLDRERERWQKVEAKFQRKIRQADI